MSQKPDVVLVFPPVFEPEMPYLALPALVGSLRAAGWSVHAKDLNLEAQEALLSVSFQEHCLQRAVAKLDELESRPYLMPADFSHYEQLVRVVTAGHESIEQLSPAQEVLKTASKGFVADTFDAAMRVILRGFDLVSAAYEPARLSYGCYEQPGMAWNENGLLAAAADREHNPFIDLYEHAGLSEQLAEAAQSSLAVGFSVIDSEQMVATLSMVSGLRARLPKLRVVLGGPYLTKLVGELEPSGDFFSQIDAVVIGEGETPLQSLLSAWQRGSDLAQVPNLMWSACRAGSSGGREVRVNRPFGVESAATMAMPDFSDLSLGRYWSPEPVLPIQASRGCYWGRCAFCAHSYIFRRRFAQLPAELVAARMAELQERHGVRAFFFVDEGLSAPFVRRLAAALKAQRSSLWWGMEARFERGFDRKTLADAQAAGLRLTIFGLESFNERVLHLMKKGVRRDDIRRIVDDCIDLGIAVHLWAIAGFPTETFAEASETLEFIFGHERLSESADFAVGLNRFALTRHCPVEKSPDSYGIVVLPQRPDETLLTVSRYVAQGGMEPDQLDEVFIRFDMLERSLPPDARRTGRVYHLLRRAFGQPNLRSPDTSGKMIRLAVRRSHFDITEVQRGIDQGRTDPIRAGAKAMPYLGVDLLSGRVQLHRGRFCEQLDQLLGSADHAVLRLTPQ